MNCTLMPLMRGLTERKKMTKPFRVVTFNANGIRSANTKGFFEWFMAQDADVLCVQELKAQEADIPEALKNLPGYHAAFHCAQKKGYSGVGIWTRKAPLGVVQGLGVEEFDAEGRYVEADLGGLTVASIYFPSGTSGDDRQEVKYRFLDLMKNRLAALAQAGKPYLFCADVNIAHKELDIKNWKGNLDHTGFLPEERQWMTDLFNSGWVDVYRKIYPDKEQYTWWSQRGQARAKNVGWRIDYQIGLPAIGNSVLEASVFSEIKYSDHAPLTIDYDFSL